MRLVRNVWTKGGAAERVKAVKYMWALFACNDLLFRRFGVGDTGDCACCAGRRETAWHVVGACDDPKAAAVRVKWAGRKKGTKPRHRAQAAFLALPLACTCFYVT